MPVYRLSTGERTVTLEAATWLLALGRYLADTGAGSPRALEATQVGRRVRVVVDGRPLEISWESPAARRARAHGEALARLVSASDPRSAATWALEACMALAPYDSGTVLVVEGRYLRFLRATGPTGARLEGVRLPTTQGVVGYALQSHRPVVVGQAARPPRHYGMVDELTGYDIRAILAVPLRWGGEALGVLELMNPPADHPFDGRAQAGVERVAHTLAERLARLTGRGRRRR